MTTFEPTSDPGVALDGGSVTHPHAGLDSFFSGILCGSIPKYSKYLLDCVGATPVIAYLESNYPCLSHSQQTQALIEFFSLWVMSYLF